MLIVAATGNPHKLDELRAILGPMLARKGIEFCGLDRFSTAPPEPDESGTTFAANARIKAVAYARAIKEICLADDSGLEVDALNGEPGVHSAHWAGTAGSRAERDARNNAKLLDRIAGVKHECRSARFTCAMCLATPSGAILHESRGTFAGVITDTPRGAHGFGYDPFLWIPELSLTSAELPPHEKNARSHRGAAARAMAAWIEGNLSHDSLTAVS